MYDFKTKVKNSGPLHNEAKQSVIIEEEEEEEYLYFICQLNHI